MLQLYCNKEIRKYFWPENLRGTYLQMLFRDNNWATLSDVCTRSLTVATWIISFPKVLIGCALSNH